MRMLDQRDENDISVSWEDQEKINAFSRFNTRLLDLEGDLKQREEEREALDDLNMELELVDEEEEVLYKIGETFIYLSQPSALSRLEQDTQKLDEVIARLKREVDECEEGMKELKVGLYAKFGNNINLERD